MSCGFCLSRRERLTLSAVEHAGSEHLVPDLVVVSRILTDDESFKVLLDEPTGGWATETGSVTDLTIGSGQLDKDRTEDTDTPGCTGVSVLLVLVHRA